MAISEKEIEHLAELSRLGLGEDEKKRLAPDLERILEYVGELQKVDTDKVEPLTGGTSLFNVARVDQERGGEIHQENILEQAPELENKHFKVPRVFE